MGVAAGAGVGVADLVLALRGFWAVVRDALPAATARPYRQRVTPSTRCGSCRELERRVSAGPWFIACVETGSVGDLQPRGIEANGPRGVNGSRYVTSAVSSECAAVASAADGQRNHTLNATAYKLGQLVGADRLDHHQAHAALRPSGNKGCKKTSWSRGELVPWRG